MTEERNQTSTDGGVDTSPFDTVAETKMSRSERYRRSLDRSLVAPFRILWNDWRGKIGFLIVSLYVFMGTMGVVIISPPVPHVEQRWMQPLQSLQFPLGTNGSGLGILRQIVHATPGMLKMILAGAVFAVIVGALVGMIAGYVEGIVDHSLMMVTDAMMTLPGVPLVIVIATIFEPSSPFVIGILLAINNWSGLARSVRSQVLTIREENYVEASRAMGVPLRTIIRRDITPNLMPYIAINFVGASRAIIFESVGLYFLGVLPTNKPNWGVMINQAYSRGAVYSLEASYTLLIPMFTVILFALGLVLLAQSLDRVFNPRVRARHAETTADEDDGTEEGPTNIPTGNV